MLTRFASFLLLPLSSLKRFSIGRFLLEFQCYLFLKIFTRSLMNFTNFVPKEKVTSTKSDAAKQNEAALSKYSIKISMS